MKRSTSVPLVLIGTMTLLSGCNNRGSGTYTFADGNQEYVSTADIGGETAVVRQHTYASLDDCRKDWGTNDQDCRPSTGGGGGGGGGGAHGGGYIGPRYVWNHAGGYPMVLEPNGQLRAMPAAHIKTAGVSSAARGSTAHAVSVSRGGFGSTAHGFSAGG